MSGTPASDCWGNNKKKYNTLTYHTEVTGLRKFISLQIQKKDMSGALYDPIIARCSPSLGEITGLDAVFARPPGGRMFELPAS